MGTPPCPPATPTWRRSWPEDRARGPRACGKRDGSHLICQHLGLPRVALVPCPIGSRAFCLASPAGVLPSSFLIDRGVQKPTHPSAITHLLASSGAAAHIMSKEEPRTRAVTEG